MQQKNNQQRGMYVNIYIYIYIFSYVLVCIYVYMHFVCVRVACLLFGVHDLSSLFGLRYFFGLRERRGKLRLEKRG